jgi:hypothetical protein
MVPNGVAGQASVRDSSIVMFLPGVVFGGYGTGGKLAQRFSFVGQIGLDFGVKFKSNLYIFTGATFLFSDNVKENPIGPNLLSYGSLIDDQGRLVSFYLSGRGFTVPLRVGYIINKLRFPRSNPNSGVFIEVGGQYIQHFIAVQTTRAVTILQGAYRGGFDRLTQGGGLLTSVGYRHFGNRRLANFMIAFDAQLNYTRSVREYNFDERGYDKTLRFDLLIGFRLAWYLPVYRAAPDKFYYY